MIAKLRMRAASMRIGRFYQGAVGSPSGAEAPIWLVGNGAAEAAPLQRTIDETSKNSRRPTTRPESGIIEVHSCRRGDGSSCIPDVDSGFVRSAAEAGRTHALSARAHAGAAVPLQPGLRRMWQDPVPGPHPEDRSFAGRLL